MIYWDRAKHDTCVSLHSPAAPTTAAPVRVFGKSSSAKFLQNFMKVWREQSWRELGKKTALVPMIPNIWKKKGKNSTTCDDINCDEFLYVTV